MHIQGSSMDEQDNTISLLETKVQTLEDELDQLENRL
jgi:hypothetical protein